jgi:snapalysin
MSKRTITRLSVCLIAVTGMGISATSLALAAPPGPHVVYYDPSGAEEFTSTVDQAAQVWNSRVKNVRLERVNGGGPVDVTFISDDAWPYASPAGLGHGRIDIGKQAVQQGDYPLRIVAHELGHILGLPDNRTGLCSDLMSGHSAPNSCQNAAPSDAEAAEVDSNFAN